MRTRVIRLAGLIATLLASLAPSAAGSGDRTAELNEIQIRAGYLYNFTKFVEWPPDVLPENGALTFCVWDNDRLAEVLQTAVRYRSAGQHPLAVRRVYGITGLSGCHVIYLAENSQNRANQLQSFLAGPAGRQVLSVGEDERCAPPGCLMHFLYEGGRIAFAFRPAVLSVSQLKVSSKLLRLAQIR